MIDGDDRLISVGRRRVLLGLGGTASLAGCFDDAGDDSEHATITDDEADGADDEADGGSETDETTPHSSDEGEDGLAPALEISRTEIDEREPLEGDSVTITITVENTGASEREFDVNLHIGDEFVGSEVVTVGGNDRSEIEFTVQVGTPGTRDVVVNGERVDRLVVRAETLDTVRDVCAHYYPWYGAPAHDWRGGQWSLESPSTPVLGDYHSTDSDVIEKHVDWCHAGGISWLNVSWWGAGSHEDDRLKDDILSHPRADELQWSILYETTGRFGQGSVDMGDQSNRRRLRTDLEYLSETYFDREIYKRIDDRPVLYVYVANVFDGDLKGAYEHAVDAAGVRPYLIADLPETSTLDAHAVVEIADAVTTYNPYAPRYDIEEVFLDRMESAYRAWYLARRHVDIDLIPTALPGFDDSEITHVPRDNPVLEPSPERYERAAKVARRFADGPVFVTSFNEWYEDTQIEPSEEYGMEYLDVTADVLATGDRSPPTIDGETLALEFERTVPESELNPNVDDGRDLTTLVERLTVRDRRGKAVLDVDVGGEEAGITFLLGAYETERTSDATWRWLGGTESTVIHAETLPQTGSIELVGRAAADMSVTAHVDGEVRGGGSVATDHGSYVLEYG